MARILGIGIATLDIINEVEGYPPEDAEVRALGQRIACGGNAAHTLTVLSLLGHHCAFGGVVTTEPDGVRVRYALESLGIDLTPCRELATGKTPTSYICLNRRNGSRTIVHYRDLPEYSYEDFAHVDLSTYDWLHFEGRDIDSTRHMLNRVRNERADLPISLEIEKPRVDIETLFKEVGLLIFSRAYAQSLGYSEPAGFLQAIATHAPAADLVCAWGEQGAVALSRYGEEFRCPAFPPKKMVDTLGAGDTFNAGIIDALVRGSNLATALEAANRLAGRKCGFVGFEGLGS